MRDDESEQYAMATVVKPEPSETQTWWMVPREGFTSRCVERFGSFATIEVAETVTLLQARADLIATAMAVKQARQTRPAIRRAVLVSN